MFRTLTFNLESVEVREATLEGEECLVVPMVMLTEGVHAGSEGPVLYLEEELSKFPEVWNHKPVVVYHPEYNGKPMSACEPLIMETQKVGIILNTIWAGGKLKAEAWLNKKKLKKIDERILDNLTNKKKTEVSTGLFMEYEQKPGEFSGKAYNMIGRNFRPDHLAILPDKEGACNIAAGAGLLANELKDYERSLYRYCALLGMSAKDLKLTKNDAKLLDDFFKKEKVVGKVVNEMSYGAIHSSLSTAIRASWELTGKPWWGYVVDVFEGYCIYCTGDHSSTYMQEYTATDDGVKLVGKPKPVERVIQYQTADGTPVGNSAEPPVKKESTTMDKKQVVNAMISGGVFVEADRTFLEALDEVMLGKFAKQAEKPAPAPTPDPTPTPAGNQKPPVVNTTPAPTNPAEWLTANNAPPQVRNAVMAAVRFEEETKANLIQALIKNEGGCPFQEPWLKERSVEELQGMVALAGMNKPQHDRSPQSILNPSFFGLGGGPAPHLNQHKEEPLILNLSSRGDGDKQGQQPPAQTTKTA